MEEIIMDAWKNIIKCSYCVYICISVPRGIQSMPTFEYCIYTSILFVQMQTLFCTGLNIWRGNILTKWHCWQL